MPASAPALASSPAQNALPMTALTTGTIGRKKPISDAGETGQDQKDGFRGDIDCAAARYGRAQASIPKKSEDDD